MAGEIQLNSVSLATESGGTVTLNSSTDIKGCINASGSAPIYACRAWINFNGTGFPAIRDSGNVSSITDNGGTGGDYTVNFTTAMPDANFCVVGSAGNSTVDPSNENLSCVPVNASSARVESFSTANTVTDQPYVMVSVFR